MAGAGGDGESSEDDIEVVPHSVDNYWLEDRDETPVSFASLPYFKTGQVCLPDKLVYVRGTQDNGTRLYMKAMAWKLELTEDIKPIFHLKTEKYWIMLKKPRKSFETTIRSIISTATFLNHALVNPDDSDKVAWNHVRNVYKSWDVAPGRDDLAPHLLVIRHLIESNEQLAASSALQTIHTGVSRKMFASARVEVPQRRKPHQYDNEGGHLDVDEESDDCGGGAHANDDAELGETVCCICDDGGDMICCDGPCRRSFHFKGAAPNCPTVDLREIDADRMDKFFCPNCKFKQHQCYACGELGRSHGMAGAAREVFKCNVATCGHFYHPTCVTKLVLRDKGASEQAAMAESIKEGKGFKCPMHNCWKCGKEEVKEAKNLQFGICRRCPRAWHHQCLPLSLLHDAPKRCWYGLLPNKILVYCDRHTIIPELATPVRNHVKFPMGPMPSVCKRVVKENANEEGKKRKLSNLASLKKEAATSLKNPGRGTAVKLSEWKKRKPSSFLKQTKPEGYAPKKIVVNQRGVVGDSLPAINGVKERSDASASVKQGLSSQEITDFGKSRYKQLQPKSVSVNEFTGGGEAIGDLDKKKSGMLQVEDAITKLPSGAQGTTSNLDTFNTSKLDQIMRRKDQLQCDISTQDTQVHGNSLKSCKVETTADYSNDDGFVPLKQRMILKRKGMDSSIDELSGSQSNQNSCRESSEKPGRSFGHGVAREERETNDVCVCGAGRKKDELDHDNHRGERTSEKYFSAKEAELSRKAFPNRQDISEPGQGKFPDKYVTSRQGEDEACSSSVVDTGKLCVGKNAKSEETVNPELSKPMPSHDIAAQYVNRNFQGQQGGGPQWAQRQHPLMAYNAQMPGYYNGAALATLNGYPGLHSPYPPSSMQDINYANNQCGIGHPFGTSGASGVHFQPEVLMPHQYFGPSTFIPPNPAPFYVSPQPLHLPPGYGAFRPEYYDPSGFKGGFLPIQPQYSPLPERPPNQQNTGGWFED